MTVAPVQGKVPYHTSTIQFIVNLTGLLAELTTQTHKTFPVMLHILHANVLAAVFLWELYPPGWVNVLKQ